MIRPEGHALLRSERAGKGGLILASVLICLCGSELLLRWLRPLELLPAKDTRIDKFRLYGWAPTPGSRLTFVDPETGETEVTIADSQGWRDVEHSLAKPAGRIRIVVVGDSFTYGTVRLGLLYTRRVEAKLRSRGVRDVEVVSIGVGGWGTDQELEAVRNEAVRYSPDFIVYQFCSNDLINLDPPPAVRGDQSLGLHKPFRYLVEDGALIRIDQQSVDADSAAKVPGLALMRRSALFRSLARLVPAREEPLPVPDPRTDRVTFSNIVARFGLGEAEKRWQRRAWGLFEALVREMKAVSEASGSRFLIFSEAGEEGMRQHLLGTGQISTEGGLDFAPVSNWPVQVEMQLPLRQLAGICERNRIPLIAPQRIYWRYPKDWHANRAGNENMADDIVDFLEAWPPFQERTGRSRGLLAASQDVE